MAAEDLHALNVRWAVIGGLAVAFRTEPRFTKDVDVVVAVSDDAEADLASLIGQAATEPGAS